MKLSKADAKTLVELLIKAGKDVGYSVRAKHISASDTDWDIIFFDIKHLDDKDFDEVCKYIDEFNSSDINSALSDLNSALKDGIEALENYDKNKQKLVEIEGGVIADIEALLPKCDREGGYKCTLSHVDCYDCMNKSLDKITERIKILKQG